MCFFLTEAAVALTLTIVLLCFSFQHEVIAVSEKVIVRLADLVKWSVQDWSSWSQGLKAEPLKPSVVRELGTNGRREALHRYRESTLTSGLNFKDVQRERAQLGELQLLLLLSAPQVWSGLVTKKLLQLTGLQVYECSTVNSVFSLF